MYNYVIMCSCVFAFNIFQIQEKISLLNKEDKQSPTTHSLLIHQYEEWDSDQVYM